MLTQKIKSSGGNPAQNCNPLIVLVRDFTLDLEIDGEPCTADDYLENSLRQMENSRQNNTWSKRKTSVLECLYPRRCFTLPQPVGDQRKLKELAYLDESELDMEFKAKCRAAISVILKSLQQRKYGITGKGV